MLAIGMKFDFPEVRYGAQQMHSVGKHHRRFRKVTLLAIAIVPPVRRRIEFDNQIVKHVGQALLPRIHPSRGPVFHIRKKMTTIEARQVVRELLKENRANSGSTMEGVLGRKYVQALRMLLEDPRIMMPREDVAELKEELQEALSLIMPTRPLPNGGIEYLTPTPSAVQNGAVQIQSVLQRFPFHFVGTKPQEQLKAARERKQR